MGFTPSQVSVMEFVPWAVGDMTAFLAASRCCALAESSKPTQHIVSAFIPVTLSVWVGMSQLHPDDVAVITWEVMVPSAKPWKRASKAPDTEVWPLLV